MTPAKKSTNPAKLKAQKKREARARLKEESAAAASDDAGEILVSDEPDSPSAEAA